MTGAGESMLFSESFTCTNCGASIAEIQPRTFSFNSPHGACDRCDGLGSRLEIDPALVVPNEDLSVNEGAVVPWANSQTEYHRSVLGALADKYGIDLDVPWRELPEEHRYLILFGTNGERIYVSYRNRYNRRRQYMTRFDGVVGNLERRYAETDSEYRREKIEEFMSHVPCPKCRGARLRPEALAVTVGGKNVYEFTELSVTDAQRFFDGVEFTAREWIIGERVVKEIRERLGFLVDVGLGYLTLSRSAGTLSGGEAQRIRLASQVGSGLVGVLYVLDEPSIGLHQRDNRRLLTTLEKLRDLGNTLIVVEHDEETIRSADYVVDVGPGAGVHGGEVIATGSVEDIEAEERSVTGDFLAGRRRIEPPEERREPTGSVELLGAMEHNLKERGRGVPARGVHLYHGRLGLGQEHAGQRDPLQGPRQRRQPRKAPSWKARGAQRCRGRRQGHRHRPEPDREDAPIQPGDLHQGLRPHKATLRLHAGGQDQGLQARTLLFQRKGRPVRGVPGGRPDPDRDALPP